MPLSRKCLITCQLRVALGIAGVPKVAHILVAPVVPRPHTHTLGAKVHADGCVGGGHTCVCAVREGLAGGGSECYSYEIVVT